MIPDVKIPCEVSDRAYNAYLKNGKLADALQVVTRWMRSHIAEKLHASECLGHKMPACHECVGTIVDFINHVS